MIIVPFAADAITVYLVVCDASGAHSRSCEGIAETVDNATGTVRFTVLTEFRVAVFVVKTFSVLEDCVIMTTYAVSVFRVVFVTSWTHVKTLSVFEVFSVLA